MASLHYGVHCAPTLSLSSSLCRMASSRACRCATFCCRSSSLNSLTRGSQAYALSAHRRAVSAPPTPSSWWEGLVTHQQVS